MWSTTSWAPGVTRLVFSALMWPGVVLAFFIDESWVYAWAVAFLLMALAMGLFNVSIKVDRDGIVRIYVCAIRVFTCPVQSVDSIKEVDNLDSSWSVKYSIGYYLSGYGKWWAAAGLPVIEINGRTKSILVTCHDFRGLREVVADMSGRSPDDISGTTSIVGI